jgi:hypothetical protein
VVYHGGSPYDVKQGLSASLRAVAALAEGTLRQIQVTTAGSFRKILAGSMVGNNRFKPPFPYFDFGQFKIYHNHTLQIKTP